MFAFETCCKFWSGEPADLELLISLLVGSCVTLILYYLHRKTPTNFPTPSSTTSCASPTCIRCSNQNIISDTTLEKIKALDECHERIKTALLAQPKCQKTCKDQLQKPTVFFIPELSAKTCFDPQLQLDLPVEYVHDVKSLEQNYESINAEFLLLYSDRTALWCANTVPKGQWSIFHILNQGVWVEENCQCCPVTVSVLKKLKKLLTDCSFGNASFSVVGPRTSITEHYGPTNARMRCHLGLVVPEQCKLTVGERELGWEEGKCILFGDSFLHSVECNFDVGYRAVLMLDFWHPALLESECSAIRSCYKPISPVIKIST